MADQIATLELALDSRPAASLAAVLDKLTAAATASEAAANKLLQAVERQASGFASTANAAGGYKSSVDKAAEAQQRQTEGLAKASQAAAAYQQALGQVSRAQEELNQRLRVRTDFGGAERAQDIEAYGKALDRLQAKYDPLFAAGLRYRTVLDEIDKAERVGALSAEVAIQARLREQASYDNLVQTLQSLGRARKEAAQAVVNVQTIVPDRGVDIAAYGKSLDDLRAKFNPLFAAGRTYRDTLAEISQAAKVGAISEVERMAAITRTKDAFTAQVAAIKAGKGGLDDHTQSIAQAIRQLQLLGFQINDIATGLAVGQSPFMILAQQGGQVYQALSGPGGVSAGLQNVTTYVRGLITPATLAGTALAGAAVLAYQAWSRFDDQQRQVLGTLQGVGRGIALNVAQFDAMAQRIAQQGQISVASATAIANALARTGNIGPTNIERVSTQFRDLAATFAPGGDFNAGLGEVVRLFGSGAAGLEEMNKRITKFQGNQLAVFQNLLRQNDIQGAIGMVLDALPGKVAKANETVSRLSDYFNGWKTFISNADIALGRLIQRTVEGKGPVAEFFKNLSGTSVPGILATDAFISPDILRSRAPSAPAPTSVPLPPPRPPALTQMDNSLQSFQNVVDQTRALGDLNQKLTEAREKTKDLADQMAIGSQDWKNAQADAAAYRTVQESGTEEEKRATLATRDHTKVQEIFEGVTKRLADVNKVAEQTERDRGEAQSTMAQVLKSTTDAQGLRITQERHQAEVDQIAIDKINARTEEEKAAVAVREAVANQYGRRITLQQAENEVTEAGRRVHAEYAAQLRDMARDQDMEAERLKLERSLIFASTEERVRAIAALQKEQELRRAGFDTSKPEPQARIKQAAQTAADAAQNATFQKGWDDAKRAVGDFASSFVSDMAKGVKAADALANAAKQVGQALISGGMKSLVEGVASQNWLQAGIGGAEVAAGFIMNSIGPSEKSKQRKQQMMDAWTKAQQDDFDAIQKQQQAVIQAGIDSAKASQQAAEDAARQAEEAQQRIEAIQRRIEGFQDRAFTAGLDTSTFEGQMAAFERQAQRQREAEVRAGGEALVDLEAALYAERARIVQDFFDQVMRRIEGYQDRLLSATVDSSTLAGQLAIFDRQAQRQREAEARAGGFALADLEAALYAERARIVQDFVDRAIAEEKRRYDEARQFLDQFSRSIKQFVDSLTAGTQSPLSPQDRLTAAQTQYNQQLALAQTGNRDALTGITGYASNLLDAAKAFYASSTGFQNIFTAVTGQLTALPSQITPEDLIVSAIQAQTDTLATILDRIDVNGDGMISRQEASNTFLQSIFDEIDVNGDNQLSKLELIRFFTAGTQDSVDINTVQTDVGNATLNAMQGILTTQQATLVAMQGVLTTQQATLVAVQNILTTQQGILNAVSNNTSATYAGIQNQINQASTTQGLLQKIVWNTAQAVPSGKTPQFAAGGWINGPGSATSDSIAARLSNGEFIVNAASARIYGPTLEAINRGAALPAMPVPVANDNSALFASMATEIRSLQAAMARLLTSLRGDVQQNTRVAVAGHTTVAENLNEVKNVQSQAVREMKRKAS